MTDALSQTGHQRPAGELRLDNRARLAAAALKRYERKAAEATELAEVERAYLAGRHRDACERFDLDLPFDPLLLDVLDSIDVVAANRWIWRGSRNNNGLATLRYYDEAKHHEHSLVRYLAIQLGVIEPDEHGTLYPVEGDTEDVNPFHRDLRASPRSVGNHVRFNGQRSRDSA